MEPTKCIAAATPSHIADYFQLLESICLDEKLNGDAIWNMDEKGWSKALQRPVLVTKGVKQVMININSSKPIFFIFV
jgi:hypothetical protein